MENTYMYICVRVDLAVVLMYILTYFTNNSVVVLAVRKKQLVLVENTPRDVSVGCQLGQFPSIERLPRGPHIFSLSLQRDVLTPPLEKPSNRRENARKRPYFYALAYFKFFLSGTVWLRGLQSWRRTKLPLTARDDDKKRKFYSNEFRRRSGTSSEKWPPRCPHEFFSRSFVSFPQPPTSQVIEFWVTFMSPANVSVDSPSTIKYDFGSTWTLTTFISVTMVTKVNPPPFGA